MLNNKGKIKIESTAKKKQNPYKDDVIWDPMGQWKYPGQVTKVPSGDISMYNVPYPVYGIDNLGNSRIMYPNMNYQFPGNRVTEYPLIPPYEVPNDDFFSPGRQSPDEVLARYGGIPKRGQIYDRLGRLHSISSYVPFAKTGGSLSPAKARKILHDGMVHGKPITDKQRRYFGYISNLKNGGSNTNNMSQYNNFKGRKMPFPQIQTEAEFFSPLYHNVKSPYSSAGSFKMGGFPTFSVFPTQPTRKEISSYGQPNWPYYFAQDGGTHEEIVYNATMDAMGKSPISAIPYRWPTVPGAYGQYYGGYQQQAWPPMYSTPTDSTLNQSYPEYYGDIPDQRYGGSKKKKKKPCYKCGGARMFMYHEGGPADFNQGPDYFTNKQNEFTNYLRNQAMEVTANEITGFHQMPDGSMMSNAMMNYGGPTGYTEMFPNAQILKSGGWIQKVSRSIKARGTEGVCTGSKFGGPTCPPGSRRYNLAKTFRKIAKRRKKQDGGEMQEEKWEAIIALVEQGIVNPIDIATQLNSEGIYSTTPEEVQGYLDEYSQMGESAEPEMQMGGPMNDMDPNAMNMINMYSNAYNQAEEDSDVMGGLFDFADAGINAYSNMSQTPGQTAYIQPQETQNPGLPPIAEYRKYGGSKKKNKRYQMAGQVPYGTTPYRSFATPDEFNRAVEEEAYRRNMIPQTLKYAQNPYQYYPGYHPRYFPANFSPNARQKFKLQGRNIQIGVPGQIQEGYTQYPGVTYGPASLEKYKDYNNIFGSGRKFKFKIPYYGELPEKERKELKTLPGKEKLPEPSPELMSFLKPSINLEPDSPEVVQEQYSSLPLPRKSNVFTRTGERIGEGIRSALMNIPAYRRHRFPGYGQFGGDFNQTSFATYGNQNLNCTEAEKQDPMSPCYEGFPMINEMQASPTSSKSTTSVGNMERTPTGYLTGKYKETYGNQMQGEDAANWAIAGLGLLGNIFSQDEKRNAEKQLRKRFKAENIFTSRQDRDRGDYTLNYGYFRPDQMSTGRYITGKMGGTYQMGGEYELTDEEIQDIINQGGQVEFI